MWGKKERKKLNMFHYTRHRIPYTCFWTRLFKRVFHFLNFILSFMSLSFEFCHVCKHCGTVAFLMCLSFV